MKLAKILRKLDRLFKKGEESNSVRCEKLDDLLDELKSKEKKIGNVLLKEGDPEMRKKLKLEAKIISMELAKARQRRKELGKKCK